MNRKTRSFKLIILLFIELMVSIGSYAQIPYGFHSKKHPKIAVDKSTLNHKVKSGVSNQKHFLQNPRIGNIDQSLGNLLPNSKNIRTASHTKIITSNETGRPIYIATPKSLSSTNARIEVRSDKRTACYAYLTELASITKISNPAESFDIKKIETEANGKTHIRLSQKYKGVKIYGSESMVHLNALGLGELFNGSHHIIDHNSNINLEPGIGEQEAVNLVISDVSTKTKYRTLGQFEKELLEYEGPSVEKVLFEDKALIKSYLLAYHVSIHPNFIEHWEYIVDANSGRILESYKNTCHVDGPRTATATDLNGVSRTINTYEEGTGFTLSDYSRSMFDPADTSGIIVTMDANFTYGNSFSVEPIVHPTNTWTDPIAVSAHYNAGVAFEYYKNAHGRNSIDGNGGTIYSFINVVDPETGLPFDNAFWNNKFMYYGNGDVAFKPLAGGMDVGGHEMTHGVVQNSANLRYQGESGAINESMADIFGTMMDSTDWLIGEDVVILSEFPSGALRSLSDPHNGGSSLSDPSYQPRHLSEKYLGAADNGGVHINSGIPNWAFYKYATALGSRNKASQVYYRALTYYLTQNSQFIDLRLAVIKAAEDLYGTGSTEATEAGLAFDAVGIVIGSGSGGGTVVNTLPVNPGTEYLLSYDTNVSLPADGLLRSTPLGANFSLLTDKSVANKPSVMDNGNTCVYVGTDNKIYKINVNPAFALNNVVLQNLAVWSSVAISKDGNRIAATTIDQDTGIYVIDLLTNQITKFQLYNPTFTQGVKSGGPLYADALEWDYSGEYLVYDCYNEISNTAGGGIPYWDINMIKVWDNVANDFGDGEIFKLFNNLQEGEGIGNPAFAKNSPSIIAFDYVNDYTGEYAVFGLDIEQNNLGVIALNNYLGWPSFNKTDTRVAFTGDDGSGNLNIYGIDLNSDKISTSVAEVGLIANAMWPVYYSVGVRDISTDIDKSVSEAAEIKLYPNPVKNELSVQIPSGNSDYFQMEIINQLGQSVLSKSFEQLNGNVLLLNVSELPSGIYSLHIKGNNFSNSKKFVKQDSGSR